jgi:hypothetical protein
MSLRVRFMNVSFKDVREKRSLHSIAFLIEDIDDMAKGNIWWK